MNFSKLTIPTKLYSLLALLTASLLGYGFVTRQTIDIAKIHGPYYQQIVEGKDLIADILPPPNFIVETYMTVLSMVNDVEDKAGRIAMEAYTERCNQLRREFNERHAYWLNSLEEGELKTTKTIDCYEPAARFYQALTDEFVPACLAEDATRARQVVRETLRPNFEQHREAVVKTVELAMKANAVSEAEIAGIVKSRATLSTGIGVALLALCWGLGITIVRQIVTSLSEAADRLQTLTSRDLKVVASDVKRTAERTSGQANIVTSAASQVSSNVQSLATAVDQFDASIKEISCNTSSAVNVARNAVDAANQTTETVTKLGASSSEIGNVIKVINSIAEQTNLLALNATIEAARAGEAGKGFAVVANEVKELAKQTSEATEDIIRRIETIQSDTQQAVDAITLVSTIIGQINESQNAIASAVEEQSAMTGEISRNINEVAGGSNDIASSIAKVAESATSTLTRTDDTLRASYDIAEVAVSLRQLVRSAQRGLVDHDVPTPELASAPANVTGKYQLSQSSESSFAQTT